MCPEPLYPLLEANQGLLSLAALVTALFFAVREYERANRAVANRVEEYREAVLSILDDVQTLAESHGVLGFDLHEAIEMLEPFRRMPIQDPRTLRALAELNRNLMSYARQPGDGQGRAVLAAVSKARIAITSLARTAL